MATNRTPRFKECRRLGINTCGNPKAMKRLENTTGFRRRNKVSEYGLHLLEKQKLIAYYGIFEKQLSRYFEKAEKMSGKTGDNLLNMLECRLDNIVYRIGFANSIRLARQQVNHGHILVNGKKVDIPSAQVKVGDVVTLREKSRKVEAFAKNFQEFGGFPVPYIEKNAENFSGTLIRLPERQEIPVQVEDHLIVEYYSK